MVEKLEPPELKPCPFCAGKANLDHENNLAYVFCGSCGTISPICMSDEDAMAAWNRRDPNAITLDPADEGLVETGTRAIAALDGCTGEDHPEVCGKDECCLCRKQSRAVIAEIMKGRGG